MLKKYYSTILMLSFLVSASSLQAQEWESIQEVPPGIFTETNKIAGTSIVYALQQYGVTDNPHSYFVKSKNNGESFEEVVGPFSNSESLSCFSFVDANLGWLAGANGAIYKTEDGGVTWEEQESGTTRVIQQIFFTDENTGYASGHGYGLDNTLLLKTTDGGVTWEDISIYSIVYERINSMIFVNENTGYIGAYVYGGSSSAIIKTSDGGLTWTELDTPDSFGDALTLNINSIDFVDDNVGYAIASSLYYPGELIKTTDAGETWTTALITDGKYCWMSVQDADNIAVICSYSAPSGPPKLYTTNDGGDSFDVTAFNLENELYYGSHFYSIDFEDDKIFLGGRYATIVTTDESGNEERYAHLGPRINGMAWKDELNGVAIFGGEIGRTQRGAYVTSNGGSSWQLDWDTPGGDHIQYLDEMNGYILEPGWAGKVWKTTDGGETWTFSSPGAGAYIVEMYFANEMTGWVSGNSDYLKKTTDGGATWTDETMPLHPYERAFFELTFLDENVGFAAGGRGNPPGYGGFILYTVDGGTTWLDGDLPNDYRIIDVDFKTPETGYAVNAQNEILKSTDGGVTWDLINTTSFLPVSIMAGEGDSLSYLEVDQAPYHDNRGYLRTSNNGGASFSTEYVPDSPQTSFLGLSVQNENRKWLYGNAASLILHSSEDIVVAGISDYSAENFVEVVVYPNPFNEQLTFDIDAPLDGSVNIKFYNTIGELVYTQSAIGQSGHSLISVDPSSLSAGMYVYQIEINGNVVNAGKVTRR